MADTQRFIRKETVPNPGSYAGIPALTVQPRFRTKPSTIISEAVARSHPTTVLVCAPAGTGKTVLLADWLHRHASRPAPVRACWVTLTDGDNIPSTLWAHLTHAVLGLAASDQPLPAGVSAAGSGGNTRGAPAELAGVIATLDEPVVIVLDDAHVLHDPLAVDGVSALLDAAPPNSTVIIAGRYEPPLPWHRYAAQGTLVRLSWQDLALDRSQVAAILTEHRCTLTPSDVTMLTDLTHGWPALVRIAAISLHGHPDPHRAIGDLARSLHPVSDYLAGELIAALPDRIRRFLLSTSIVDAFTLDLAEELTDTNAADAVWFLETHGFPLLRFTPAQEPPEYRYHPLLLAHLRAELRRTAPALEASLHSIAARWYLAHRHLIATLQHVIAARAPGSVHEFTHRHGLSTVFGGHSAEMFSLLDQFGATDETMVRLLHALAAMLRQEPHTAQAYLDTLPLSTSQGPDALVEEAIGAALAIDAAIESGRQPPADRIEALAALPVCGQAEIDCYVLTQRAAAAVYTGDLTASTTLLRAALALADLGPHHRLRMRCITRLAVVAGLAGDITTMSVNARQVLELAITHQLCEAESIDFHQSLAMTALGAYLQGTDFISKPIVHPAAESRALHRRSDGTTVPLAGRHAQVVLDLLRVDAADRPHLAVEDLRADLMTLLLETPHPIASSGLVPHVTAILLEANRLPEAENAVSHASRVLGENPDVLVARAMIHTAHGRHHNARDIVAPLLECNLPLVTATRAWLVDAVAAHHLDHPNATWRSIRRAVELARPQHLVRPFLDTDAAVTLLAHLSLRTGRSDAFIDDILRACPDRSTPHALLTSTELAVLRQLPSGRTSGQISADLHVSINTVKTHLRNLYRKLGANSRAEAIAAALQQGLL